MREIPWSAFKSFVTDRYLSIQYMDVDNHYIMWAFDGPMGFECKIYKNNEADQVDFENNYKAAGNQSFSDSNGSPLYRLKIANNNTKYCVHHICFHTADLDSLKENKWDGNAFGWSTIKLYDSNGDEITDNANKANATRTVIQFEPTFTYEIQGGGLYQSTVPASNIVCNAVFAPLVPENYGGQFHFLSNACLMMMGTGKIIDIDGGVPKTIHYDATYHSGRFDFSFDHDAGVQHQLLIFLKLYI